MMNLGTHSAMQDGSRSSDGLRMLHRIAEVLDRPVSDFYRREDAIPTSNVPSSAECELMLTAFLRVTDPAARTRIIELMRSFSGN